MEKSLERCPFCGQENESRNIFNGCFQFHCEKCKRPYEGPIVDIKDFSDGEIKDYVV